LRTSSTRRATRASQAVDAALADFALVTGLPRLDLPHRTRLLRNAGRARQRSGPVVREVAGGCNTSDCEQ
jgi:hypothetical protein